MTARYDTQDLWWTELRSPLGTLVAGARGQRITHLTTCAPRGWRPPPDARRDSAPFRELAEQLEQYFAGERRQFQLELELDGTPFENQVWTRLQQIPYGETCSYGSLAAELGRPRAARAIGRINGSNPIWIAIPCHRVIAANGALTGYAGGLGVKSWLLTHERGQSPLTAERPQPDDGF